MEAVRTQHACRTVWPVDALASRCGRCSCSRVERQERMGAWGPRASLTTLPALEPRAGQEEEAGLLPDLWGWEAIYTWTDFLFGCLDEKIKVATEADIFHNFVWSKSIFFPLGRDKTNRNQTGNHRVSARFEKLPVMSSTIMSEATAYSASTLTLAASRKTLSLICRTLLRITARATPTIKLLPIRATSF